MLKFGHFRKADHKYLGSFKMWCFEKDGEDQRDRSCEKWRSVTESHGLEEYHTNSKSRRANWIGHILRRNCHLKHVIEGKIEGRIEVMGRRRVRNKQLLDDLNAKRVCYKLKEEALDRSLWRTRFRRGCGPVVRHNGMNEYSLPLEGVNIFIQYLVILSNQLHIWLNHVLLVN